LASASVQDRDGAKSVLHDTYLRTLVRFVFADGGFAGRLLEWATTQILWGSRSRPGRVTCPGRQPRMIAAMALRLLYLIFSRSS
jgi:hypothetical protein